MVEELGLAVAVGICLDVLLPEQEPRHVRILQLLAEVIQPGQEVLVTAVRKGAVTAVEDFLKLRVVKLQQLVKRQAAARYEGELVVNRLLVDAQLVRYPAVGHSLLLEQYRLFEITHLYWFSCHRHLGFNIVFSGITENHRKVNGYVPENVSPQAFMLPK